MSLDKLNTLYREVILDHAANPHHKYKLDKATETAHLDNPSCGDEIDLNVLIKDNKIEDIAFTGHGCTISQASASMMTDAVIGKSMPQAMTMAKIFTDVALGKQKTKAKIKQLGDAQVLTQIMSFPARIKCATLAWHALTQVLIESETQDD